MSVESGPDRRYRQTSDAFIMHDLRQMESATNYNSWLFSLIAPYIGRRVAEIGPGTGTMTRKILHRVDFLAAIEPNDFCAAVLDESLGGNPKFRLIKRTIEGCNPEDVRALGIDSIICVNVLEHVEDDIAALIIFREVVKPGGRIILLVPAVPAAYGSIDAAVGHFRRYSRDSMTKSIEAAGMKTERVFYSNFLGLLGWMFNARIARLTLQSNRQIETFDALVPLLSRLERLAPPLIGMSLVAIGRKKDEER